MLHGYSTASNSARFALEGLNVYWDCLRKDRAHFFSNAQLAPGHSDLEASLALIEN